MMIPHLPMVLALFFVLGASALAEEQGEDAPATPPLGDAHADQVVGYFLSLRHGPRMMAEPAREKYAKMLAELEGNPERFAPTVKRTLVLPSDDELVEGTGTASVRRVRGAMTLAVALGPEHGGGLIRNFFKLVVERLENARRAPVENAEEDEAARRKLLHTLRYLRDDALRAAMRLDDRFAIEYVLNNVSREDLGSGGSQYNMFRYLRAVARDDEEVYRAAKATVKRDPVLQASPSIQEILRDWSDKLATDEKEKGMKEEAGAGVNPADNEASHEVP